MVQNIGQSFFDHVEFYKPMINGLINGKNDPVTEFYNRL